MAQETFYLRFENETDPVNLPSDEIFGWDKANFQLKQDENRFGRDVVLNTSECEYTDRREHYVDKMLHTFDKNGFESKIIQGINADGQNIELQIDAKGMETNEIDSVKTPGLIQDTESLLLKRRMKTKVFLQNPLTIDNAEITPPTIEKIILKAYPILQTSRWEADAGKFILSGRGFFGAPSFFNVIKGARESEIQNSLGVWLKDYVFPLENTTNYGMDNPDQFKSLEAINALEEVTAVLDLDILCEYLGSEITDAPAQIQGFFVKGPGELFDNIGDPSKRFEFFNSGVLGPQPGSAPDVTEYHFQGQVTVNIGKINRGEFLWFYFRHGAGNYSTGVKTTFNSASLKLTASSVSYNTVIPCYRLYDVMKYVVKSISGLDIVAPRYDVGGEFHSLFLSNGNFFRNKIAEPFYITLEEILDSIWAQFKSDYKILPNKDVFFGIYQDFYKSVEIARFTSTQFQSLKKTINPRYALNQFRFGFKNYESQRENEQENTIDSVHGESEFIFAENIGVENVHECSVSWTMDARTIARNQRAAQEVASSAATNNDNTIFAIDVNEAAISGIQNLLYTETSFLQHDYNPENDLLALRNDGTFSWLQLGIAVGGVFIIASTPAQQNSGSYVVTSISDNQLLLSPTSANPVSGNDGERDTTYTYRVPVSSLVGVNWTDQGLSVTGLANSDRYPNLRYSLMSSIQKYHIPYLATANLFHKDAYISTTFYKNNPNAIINGIREGGEIREGFQDGIQLSDPILSPFQYEKITFVDEEITIGGWIALCNNIRENDGYITFEDNNGFLRKVFGKDVSFDNADEALIIEVGEEKFEPVIINIVPLPDGNVRINDEWEVTKLKYEPQGESYRIMDRENKLLYNPIFWDRIAINGDIAESQNQLEEWLSAL